jgi:GAF domain-containing protein
MVSGSGEAVSVAAAVCRVCLDVLPFDGAAVTAMASDQLRELLWASDPTSTQVQELQFSLGEGPALDAHQSGRPVIIGDLADLEPVRWPMLGPALAELPIGGVFAFPVAVGAITIGVLDLYRHQVGRLSAADLSTVLSVVDLIAAALLALRAGQYDSDGDAIWLEGPGSDRQVHQATGMLIVQLGMPPEQAFARLRGYAFAHDRRIGAVADEIVAGALRLDLQPD